MTVFIRKSSSVWQKNSLPLFFKYKCVKKIRSRNKVKDSCAKKEITVSLEFLGKISLQVKKQLIEIFRTCDKDIKLNVVFKSSVWLSNALRFKDQIPKCFNSMLLYKFTCNSCNSVYIGKTKIHYLPCQFKNLGLSVFTNKALKLYLDATPTCNSIWTTIIALIIVR